MFLKKMTYSYLYEALRAHFKYASVASTANLYIANAGKKGMGLFTTVPLQKNTVAFIATGPIVVAHFEGEACFAYPNWYGVDRDTWVDIQAPYVRINHSCRANLGIDGSRCFVTLRDIRAGEELTFDYSISDDELDWSMECYCESDNCTGRIGPIQTITVERFEHSYPRIPTYFAELYRNQKK